MRSLFIPFVLAAAVLAGCGGADKPDAQAQSTQRQAANAANVQKVTQSNVVVTAAAGGVQAVGPAEDIAARLSRGAIVRRGAESGTRFVARADLPLAGEYEVFAWWPQGVEGAGKVTATVHDTLGHAAVELDQSEGGGQWVSLGVFQYAPGRPARIELASQGGARVVADAFRFEHLGRERAGVRIDTELLPGANQVDPYTAVLAGAGRPPLRWSLTAGELPPGLALDGASGRIEGLPAARGEYRFDVALFDGRGRSVTRSLQIDVLEELDAPAPPAPWRAAPTKRRLDAAGGGGGPDLSGLLELLDAIPEGSWVLANTNSFSEVWTPPELRPLMSKSNPPPSKIIEAWSSMDWDPNRGDIWIYGGGHANYPGNDVYRWRGSTRQWERASLPSQTTNDDLNNVIAVDGPMNAPTSAHTYDNGVFLPIADRYMTFGGATVGRGGPYKLQLDPTTQRDTGPYFFDPTRADPMKVGGTTGSHVQREGPYPEIVGGQMWSNRDIYGRYPEGASLPKTFINGCTGYTQQGGRDVVYVGGRSGGTSLALYKYTVVDPANPAADVFEQVGRYGSGTSKQTTCAVDSGRGIVLRTGENHAPFFYWDLSIPVASNRDVPVTPVDPSGEFAALLAGNAIDIVRCGMDFDPVRRHFVLWCPGGTVWNVVPPEGAISAAGWTIVRQPLPVGPVPTQDVGKGILGKWKYVSNLDAFVGVQDSVNGNVWFYKPVGWQRPAGPSNQRPTVAMTSPASGTEFPAGQAIELVADAADADGSVVRVEFYNGMLKIGETAAGPPYILNWDNPPIGTHTLRAFATDDGGATTASAPVTITVVPGASGSLILQDGVNAYDGTRDVYLSSYYTSRNYGGDNRLLDQKAFYSNLVRFAIFEAEGGPVPDDAQITSARLMLYKWSSFNMRYRLHPMLVSWAEMQSTWNERLPGLPWAAPGARAAGADHAVAADAEAEVGDAPDWLSFDVTDAVQRMGAEPGSNHGWIMLAVSGRTSSLKRFHAREITVDVELRPRLEISYVRP